MPNVASDASVAVAGSDAGKKERREHEHRGRAVDVEVEELDRGADEAREEHLAGAVDGGGRNAAVAGVHTGSTDHRSREPPSMLVRSVTRASVVRDRLEEPI